MLQEYRLQIAERAAQSIPPKPLTAAQTSELVALLQAPPAGEEDFLLHLLSERVPPGVDEAAYVKAAFLAAVTKGEIHTPLLDRARAVDLLGTMLGGYNVGPLVELLDDPALAQRAAEALSGTLLVFDAFHDIEAKARAGNAAAQRVLQSWAEAEWFTRRPELPECITVTVFKVPGEITTDDLSPAPDAWSRPDIPLHARSMLKMPRSGLDDPLATLARLRQGPWPVAFVGDVVGTGSSRKSATNSLLWHIGQDIPHVPNKRSAGICIGGRIAPIFFNTLEDSGALPIECDVEPLRMGEAIDILVQQGIIRRHDDGTVLCRFELKTPVLQDAVRAGGRIALIAGRGLTERARKALELPPSNRFRRPLAPADSQKGYTLAQKMVGRACGLSGVRPGSYCEPHMTTVGSQDTTGPMTRDELKELACLGFSADLVLQSFCHTAAYPKPVDLELQHTLPDFIRNRGGVSLRPGDGIIHSWLNRMLLPDTVGTGGDSHTRFPIGISFPAGSGLVAFAAATGVMPLDMPESVLVRFHGRPQPGITLRDLVNAIPYAALQQGLLTLEKKGKKNVYSGRILEIEGLPDLRIEQAFEFADASAERSAAACTVRLDTAPVIEYLNSNVALLRWMIAEGYGDARTLERRVAAMENWLADPRLLEADADAEYAAVVEIDLEQIKEPLLACPNDPDDVRPLSAVAGRPIDEVFIGSCMTNIGHFRAAGRLLEQVPHPLPTRLWICPPTRMDQAQLIEEGIYGIFERVGARLEVPGCSLCMGNQARVAAQATVVSTSTRNFPNRLGDGADVFLASSVLSAVCSVLGRIPTPEEYLGHAQGIDALGTDLHRFLDFDRIARYRTAVRSVV